MTLQKTSKDILTKEEILKYISDYELYEVPRLTDLWEYYCGRNVAINKRKKVDNNNPDNRIIISYGRKIVTTYTGYAYRPKYITYKPNITTEVVEDQDTEENGENIEVIEPIEKQYVDKLQEVFKINNEHIKTNRAGRNTAIFGLSYEVVYIDSEYVASEELAIKVIPKFFTVDPREMIVLYDYSPEPKMKIAIRYYKLDSDKKYMVEVYYKDHIDTYIKERADERSKEWILTDNQLGITNYFNEVPVVAYYMGDEIQSINENVLSLIDAYDVLFSDSMNEFDRFAFAYLIMKKFGLSNPIDKKDPTKTNESIKNIKRKRLFEHLPADADIKFLTKDIPTAFIEYMARVLREQIHIQSHVPDFTSEKMNGASGIAIQRLMFDFENLVSSAEADFDTGLYQRIKLITIIMNKANVIDGSPDMVTINHKRNIPLNTQEFAQTALTMTNAGFSRRAIIGVMPEDIIPNIEKELDYEKQEQEALIGSNNLEMPLENESISEEETNFEQGV